jgi:hypothetical protein
MGGNKLQRRKVGATEGDKKRSRNKIRRQDKRRDTHGQDSDWNEDSQIDIRRFSKEERKTNNKAEAKAPDSTHVIAVRSVIL